MWVEEFMSRLLVSLGLLRWRSELHLLTHLVQLLRMLVFNCLKIVLSLLQHRFELSHPLPRRIDLPVLLLLLAAHHESVLLSLSDLLLQQVILHDQLILRCLHDF